MIQPYFEAEGVTLYHADAFELLHDLSGVGAVITDPPYSSGGAFRGDRAQSTVTKYVNSDTAAYRPEFAGDTRDQHAFLAWCALWLNAARLASVPGAVLASFIDWRQVPVLTDAVQAGGWLWRGLGTWYKPGIRMQRGRFSSSAEYIVYATNGATIDHDGAPQNVFTCPPEPDKEHIAQKPERVLSWVLELVPPGSLVLDPFMGSGTTLIAARARGHVGIGIDCDERSCEVAARRLSQLALPAMPERPVFRGGPPYTPHGGFDFTK